MQTWCYTVAQKPCGSGAARAINILTRDFTISDVNSEAAFEGNVRLQFLVNWISET